jgi:hypothetical protein
MLQPDAPGSSMMATALYSSRPLAGFSCTVASPDACQPYRLHVWRWHWLIYQAASGNGFARRLRSLDSRNACTAFA